MVTPRLCLTLAVSLTVLPLVVCSHAFGQEKTGPGHAGSAMTTAAAASSSQQIAMVDAQGFAQPMDAATFEIPVGWLAQGGVDWERRDACVANQLRIAWMAGPPDGSQAFEVMHPYSWQVQGRSIPTNPCPVLPLASARDFLVTVVQQRRPGARVLDYRDRPDIVERAEAEAAPLQAGTQQRIEAGEILIAYPAPGGDEIQERLWTGVTFTGMQNSVMGNAGIVYAHRRLGDLPDAELGARMAASMQLNPQWTAQVNETGARLVQQHADQQSQQIQQWHAREMARINAQGAADRAAIRAQTQREIAEINAQTHANTQATNDRMHRRGLEAVGEYDTYRDTQGDPVRSSIHGGDRVLQHPDGRFSSTNDPYYQPPGSVELQRIP